MDILFSILVANYNNGKYLSEAIDSILIQSYTNWEIIIVDDASTDNSHKIYETYRYDNRIKVFYNETNKGCTYSKWRCIEEADGEICGFLDADDALLPNALKEMMNAHISNPNVSLVTSRFYYCNEKLEKTADLRLLTIPDGESYLTNRDYSPEHFATFKKSYYLKTQGLNKNNKLGDDQELYLLLEEVGEFKVLDQFTYLYRQHKSNVSQKSSMKCYYWNMIIRHEACLRRGINPEDVTLLDFLDMAKMVSIDEVYNAQLKIRKSKAYRLGSFLLKPFSKFILK